VSDDDVGNKVPSRGSWRSSAGTLRSFHYRTIFYWHRSMF